MIQKSNRQREQGHKDETNNSIHYQVVSSKFITLRYSFLNVFHNIINLTMKLQACVHLHWTGSVEPSRKTHRDWLTNRTKCISVCEHTITQAARGQWLDWYQSSNSWKKSKYLYFPNHSLKKLQDLNLSSKMHCVGFNIKANS